jgi:type I restriction enzyme S subunit
MLKSKDFDADSSMLGNLVKTALGPLPSDWRVAKLRTVVNADKSAIDPQESPDEEFDYYSIPAYQESLTPLVEIGSKVRSQKLLVENNSVLFGKLNPRVPKVWRVCHDSGRRKIASTEFIPLSPIPGQIRSDYLYFLCWSAFVLPKSQELVSGSTPSRQRVDTSGFLDLAVPIPPLVEQRAIAHLLRTVQQAKEATEKVIAATRQLKKSLMRHLFTYGPVPIDQADRVELREAESGIFPKHWRLSTMANVAEVITSTSSSSVVEEDDAPESLPLLLLKVSDMNDARNQRRIITAATSFRVKAEKLAMLKTVPPGATLFPKRGAAIATNKKRLTTCSCLLDPNLLAVSPGEMLVSEFLYAWFQGFDLRSITDTTTLPQINKKDIEPIPIPVPALDDQRKIVQVFEAMDAKLETEESWLNSLDGLFRTLLRSLMTGQIRLPGFASGKVR